MEFRKTKNVFWPGKAVWSVFHLGRTNPARPVAQARGEGSRVRVLGAMVDYVTETLKSSRLEKINVIDVADANATSTMFPTGWQPSRSMVDRLVGNISSVHVSEQRSTCPLETRVRSACSSLGCGRAVRRERAGAVQDAERRGQREDQERMSGM